MVQQDIILLDFSTVYFICFGQFSNFRFVFRFIDQVEYFVWILLDIEQVLCVTISIDSQLIIIDTHSVFVDWVDFSVT